MSQHDMNIANQGFPAFRADLNAALEALVSSNSGATAPATTFANMPWYDTANNIFKIRNEDNDAWISIFTLNQSTDVITAIGSVTLADVVSLTGTQTLTNKTLTSPAINGQTVDKITDTQGGVFTPSSAIMRNRIINGAMVIDQRNAGASVTLGIATYTLDRMLGVNNSDGAITVQQDSSAPTGFTNSLKATITTADTSLATTQQARIAQAIEGYNVADLGWGTANAKTVTLSFWVRSSLTGTFGGSLQNSAQNRSYPFTYSISAADTWEQKSVTIAGDTTGTWLVTNGIGLRVNFSLGAGPDRSGTAGAWSATGNTGATGQVQVLGTLSATWYVTGVQLEVGTQATSFEYRQYQQELALCQRYYQLAGSFIGAGGSSDSTNVIVSFGTPMRSAPSTSANGVLVITDGYSSDYTQSSANSGIIVTTTLGGFVSIGNFTSLVSGRVYFARYSNNNSIAFSAEL